MIVWCKLAVCRSRSSLLNISGSWRKPATLRVNPQMQREICTEKTQPVIKNIVNCKIEGLAGLGNWLKSVATEDTRRQLVERGIEEGKQFLLL